MLQGTYALEDIDSQGIERIYAQILPSSGCTLLKSLIYLFCVCMCIYVCVCVSVCVCPCMSMYVRACHWCTRACSPAHACTRVCDFAAGTNETEGDGEAGGVGDVTKQLELQTLDDKEREEDGEEGNSLPSSAVVIVLNFKSLEVHKWNSAGHICNVISDFQQLTGNYAQAPVNISHFANCIETNDAFNRWRRGGELSWKKEEEEEKEERM